MCNRKYNMIISYSIYRIHTRIECIKRQHQTSEREIF